MSGVTRPDIPAAKVCEHFYASHCYRGMSVRLCMLCHEPDWDDLAGQLSAPPAAAPAEPSTTAPGWRAIADDLAEAIRLTREYVEPKVALPPLPGWSWYDAMCRYREAVSASAVTSPAPAPVGRSGTATGPAEGAEAALGRVAKLAESWAALAATGTSVTAAKGLADEIDAHCGRVLLDVIHGPSGAEVRLSRVTALAESWMAAGGLGLFYPAAGQTVLDAIRGASIEEATGWRERAEQAETERDRLAAELEHAKSALAGDHEGIRLWMLDCGELVAKHRARAEAAEAKLAAVAEHCRKHAEHAQLHCPDLGRPAEALVKADDILAITGTGEEPS